MENKNHKTTILLTPTLHERLTGLAQRKRVSMGHLIREAVEAHYGLVDAETRRAAVKTLGALSLPVDTPEVMKAESMPYGDGPLP